MCSFLLNFAGLCKDILFLITQGKLPFGIILFLVFHISACHIEMILHNKAEPTDKLESSFPAFKFHGLSHLILSSFPIRNQDDQFGFL